MFKDKNENNNFPGLNILKSEKENNNIPNKKIMKAESQNNYSQELNIIIDEKEKDDILQNSEIKSKNNNLINQNIIINKNENINLQNNIHRNSNKNNIILENINFNDNDDTFPEGTKYEEELSSNFTYFNVYWYNTNDTNDCEHFEKCFKNVKFFRGNNINTIINIFKEESTSEWIVVISGSKGKESLEKLEKFDCIKSFFIYYNDIKLNELWVKNNKKVGCITSSLEILCKKFIEINENYIIPNFNYKYNAISGFNLNLNGENPEKILNINSPFLKVLIKHINV